MWRNIALVAQREYLKIVKKKSFWIVTLLFPAFIVLVSFISGYSAKSTEDKLVKQAGEAKQILIVDEARLINDELLTAPFERVATTDGATQQVQQGAADAAFIYPSDVLTSHQIQIVAQSQGILLDTRFNQLSENLLRQSILLDVTDPARRNALNATYLVEVAAYKNGQAVDLTLEQFVIPAIFVGAYFIMLMFALSYLLMSVSEEKENRMIETVLSILHPRDLIWGKILGQIGVVLTQFAILGISLTVIGLTASMKIPLPINWQAVPINPWQIFSCFFYLLSGFLIMANSMVGVGAVMPNYKEAQSFSSVFMILAIAPVYFFMSVIADPGGPVALISSYFPFTAAMVLMMRSALGSLVWWESLLSFGILLIYVAVSFVLAYKLFVFGALEYKNKLSLRELLPKGLVKKNG